MADEDLDAPKVIFNLLNPSLNIRLAALANAKAQIIKAEEPKIGPLRRLVRIILSSLIDCQYTESYWTDELKSTLTACFEQPLPLPPGDFFVEFLEETKPKWRNGVGRIAVADLCVKLLCSDWSYDETTNTLSVWGQRILLLLGECIEIAGTETVKKARKLQEQGKNCVLNLLTQRPILAKDACTAWMEASLIVPLSHVSIFISNQQIRNPAFFSKYFVECDHLKVFVITQYIKRILSSKQPPQEAVLDPFAAFFATLEQADWSGPAEVPVAGQAAGGESEALEALVLRAMKKAPEGSSLVVATLLSQLQV